LIQDCYHFYFPAQLALCFVLTACTDAYPFRFPGNNWSGHSRFPDDAIGAEAPAGELGKPFSQSI
jgi:hypothetical protein